MNHTSLTKFITYCFLVGIVITSISCHVGRFFVFNFADIRDHKKFPANPIEAPEVPFQFTDGTASKAFKLPDSISISKKRYPLDAALEKSGTVAFLIIRNDSILYERYFKGYEENSIVPSFSVAKSYTSALVGIAIQEGYIKSIKDPITRYLPELNPKYFDAVTIEHLLNMRSGIDFNESYINPFGHVAKFYYGRNIPKYITKLKTEKAPDTEFNYISICPQLLGMAVERTTGKSLSQYLQEKIWQPLGMEHDASWSLDSRKHHATKAFCCLNARAHDFAKFGRLYLHNGQWNGQQIVPEAWVKASTTFTNDLNGYLYSYQWWHNRITVADNGQTVTGLHQKRTFTNKEGVTNKYIVTPSGDFYAEGILGQFIYVYPEKNIIMVRLGKKYGSIGWARFFLQLSRMN